MSWFFEILFDYGEGHYTENLPDAQGRISARAQTNAPAESHWPVRNDPFSTYRAGFEVRTYRLCRRVLMFHHIPDKRDTSGAVVLGYEGLVRFTDFHYSHEANLAAAPNPIYSFILSVTRSGYQRPAPGRDYLREPLLTHFF